MKQSFIIGLVLIVFGIGVLAFKSVTYVLHEKTVDVDLLYVSADTKQIIPLPPIMGGLAIASGIVLVIVGRKKPLSDH